METTSRAARERGFFRSAPAARTVRRAVSLLLLCAVAVPSAAQAHHGAPSTGLATVSFAKAPPDFTFNTGSGPQTLAGLRGKPVVINFWATYCPPCRDELYTFEKLRAVYGKAIDLLTITDEPAGTARAFLQERGIDVPVVDDPDGKIFAAYSLTSGGGPIPVTIVVRPDGTVSYVSIGEMTYGELEAAVAAVLTIPVVPSPAPTGVSLLDLDRPAGEWYFGGNASTPNS